MKSRTTIRNRRILVALVAGLLFSGLAGSIVLLTRDYDAGQTISVQQDQPAEAETANPEAKLNGLSVPTADGQAAADPEPIDNTAPEPAPEGYPEPPVIARAHPNPGKDAKPESGPSVSSLEWLKDHQNEEGYWSASDFSRNSGREGAGETHSLDREKFGDSKADAGGWDSDLTVTSLALLSFLGAGYDHTEGRYQAVVRQAILWLRKHQRDGAFTNARGIRDHALTTLALSESFGLSGSGPLKDVALEAARYLIDSRLPGGGWGEYAGGEADVISTAYAVMALKSAKMSGLELDTTASFSEAGTFLDALAGTPAETRYSRLRLDPPGGERDGLTRPPVCAAAWMVAAFFSGHAGHQSEAITARADLLLRDENLPKWERGRIDFEYWWLGTQAMFQTGGSYMPVNTKRWDRWQKPLVEALNKHERGHSEADKQEGWDSAENLDEHGSWDAEDIWNSDGRVSTTALANLCLQTYYRYARLEDSNEGKLAQRG